MLVLASLTDPIVEFAVDVIDAMGLPGIFLLMVAESACIPIPSETTFLFAGFNVARGEYSLFAVVATGTFANVVGSWIAYAVGYYGRVDILEKHGRKLHIKPSHLQWADDWFAALRLGDRVLHAHAADRAHVHLAAGRRRADAVLALHDPHDARLHPVDPDAHADRARGRRQLGEVEGQPALRRLRGRGDASCSARSWLYLRWRRGRGGAAEATGEPAADAPR